MNFRQPCRALVLQTLALLSPSLSAASAALLGWNDLGMHCMDADYSVFSLLPPYNTLHAQLIVNGRLVTLGGPYHITYEAAADATSSINRTSAAKTDFWDHARPYTSRPRHLR